MPKLSSDRLPKYRKHRASGQAVVTLNGRDHYLGSHGTKASKLEYDRLTAEWLANGRGLPAAGSDVTIVEVIAAFRRFAVKHYQRNGKPTGSVGNIDDALRPVKLLYGRERVRDFGPLKLKTIQAILVRGYTDAKGQPVMGLSRGVVNRRVGIIKRVFKWAVSEEIAPPSIAHALATVQGLQFGRTAAREAVPIQPVDAASVDAALGHLPGVVADMVRLQGLTGCRPGEVCILRPSDVDRSGDVWIYRPQAHKTQHHGRDRVIFIGPLAQDVLRPYLLRDAQDYCFRPCDSERQRRTIMRANRKTPVQPSQRDRSKRSPKRHLSDRYRKDSYCRAIARACKQAKVAPWTPNRLRHTAATTIRKQFGLEAAQVVLGHSRADVTQIYAERNQSLGLEVMKQIG